MFGTTMFGTVRSKFAGAAGLVGIVVSLATVSRADDTVEAQPSVDDSGRPVITDTVSLFQSLDANGDGRVTDDEIPTQHDRLFRRLIRTADADGDGAINPSEMATGLQSDRPDRPLEKLPKVATAEEEPAAVFKRMDKNRDGVLTKKEFPTAGIWDRFAKNADRNRDDKLTAGEFMRNYYRIARFLVADAEQMKDMSAGLFRKFDADGDGILRASEVPEDRRKRFKRLVKIADADNNGTLDADEFAAGTARMQQRMKRDADTPKGKASQETPAAKSSTNKEVAKLLRRAQKLDVSGDGLIDEQEARGPLAARFSDIDSDDSGLLDQHEIAIAAQLMVQRRQDRQQRKTDD